ncbi:MAG: flagellar hook-length control protein FliK, partial [Rhodospirillales bacterium]|nr:flagellar hook-length control protein FliK [Rhodospirillales bacterium]
APQQRFQHAMAGRAEAAAEAKVQGVGQANAAAGPQAPAAPAPTQPASRPAAAQQAAQPQAARPAPQSPVADQVAVQIQKAAKDGVDRITVTMRPEELGRVEVKLDVGADGRVTAMVTADNRDTLEMLQKDSRSLEKALQDAGLQTDSNSLSFNLRGDGRETHQSREQGRRGPMGRVATGLDITQDALSAPQPRTMARAGGVDIRV